MTWVFDDSGEYGDSDNDESSHDCDGDDDEGEVLEFYWLIDANSFTRSDLFYSVNSQILCTTKIFYSESHQPTVKRQL